MPADLCKPGTLDFVEMISEQDWFQPSWHMGVGIADPSIVDITSDTSGHRK